MNNIVNSEDNSQDMQPVIYSQETEVNNKRTVNNYGDIGKIENINLQISAEDLPEILSAIMQKKKSEHKINTISNIEICTDYYNLVVQGRDGDYESPFIFDPSRALTEGMKDSLKNQFSTLEPAAIRTLYTFPTLFATENLEYGHTDEDHKIAFGFIKQIKILSGGIKIYPNILFRFPQQLCNENVQDLGFYGDHRGNELNRTHWTIKQLDLIAELREMGLSEKLKEVGL